ncbi:hypothetical protein I317_06424 [Kwoniella heveanensis CBS 569]|nr:hypothetical protein I317_06424 [Kwoniella heveanensis CBS 569]
MEWEGSSLETIDENPVRSPPKLTLTPQAHSLKIKAKKVVLKRKTPQPTHSVVYNDVFSADIRDPDGIGGGDTMNKRSRSSSDEEASQEQWRVGKMPGHQGSHFRSPKKVRSRTSSPAEGEGVTGKKRTFSQSITSSAERVLKKPFRPPTRVGPKLVHTNGERKQCSSAQGSPAISHEAPASSSSPSQTVPSEPDTSLNPDFDAIFTDSPSSAGSRKSRSFHSQSQSRASKPFKVPSRQDRSFAPSPNTKSGQARSETSSEQARIVILQNEILEAKKALKVVTDSDEEQIKELIYTWRNAGREIVERLFRDIPKLDRPITSSTSAGSDSQYIAGFSQSKSISYWSSPDDDLRTPMLTPEQAEYLKNAPRNADGEPVDEDGNLLIPDSGDEARFWEELGDERRFGDEKYQGGWSRQEESRLSGPTYAGSMGTTETETGTEATAAAPDQWNYAALMRMMNVDPDLLGFDESTEEWIEYANEDQD